MEFAQSYSTLTGDEEIDIKKVRMLHDKYEVPQENIMRLLQHLQSDQMLADVLLGVIKPGNKQVETRARHAKYTVPNAKIHPDTEGFWSQWLVDMFGYENWAKSLVDQEGLKDIRDAVTKKMDDIKKYSMQLEKNKDDENTRTLLEHMLNTSIVQKEEALKNQSSILFMINNQGDNKNLLDYQIDLHHQNF